jgi:RNA polymerase sigma-70 factor (ECF subfamily)
MAPPPPDWQHEIEQTRLGSEKAARLLVEGLYPMVIRIVRSHVRRQRDEEDIAQEVFMKMFTRLDQFRGDQPLEHWVSKIALHTCYDRLRAERSRPLFSYADLDVDEAAFVDALVESGTEGGDGDRPELTLEILEKLLAGLNPREQMVIRLLDLEEKSVREVAELTGWGESKIKVTAMRARRKLSAQLKRLEPEAAR